MKQISTLSNPNIGNTGASDNPGTEAGSTHRKDKNGGGTSQTQVEEPGQSGKWDACWELGGNLQDAKTRQKGVVQELNTEKSPDAQKAMKKGDSN